jgi:hypothetical protein
VYLLAAVNFAVVTFTHFVRTWRQSSTCMPSSFGATAPVRVTVFLGLTFLLDNLSEMLGLAVLTPEAVAVLTPEGGEVLTPEGGEVLWPGMLTAFDAAEFAEDPTPFVACTTNVYESPAESFVTVPLVAKPSVVTDCPPFAGVVESIAVTTNCVIFDPPSPLGPTHETVTDPSPFSVAEIPVGAPGAVGTVAALGMPTEFETADFTEDPTPLTAWTTNV